MVRLSSIAILSQSALGLNSCEALYCCPNLISGLVGVSGLITLEPNSLLGALDQKRQLQRFYQVLFLFVPSSTQEKVDKLLSSKRPTDFTAYPEGAPGQPSWPAMHAAASALSFWLSVVLDITPTQHCEAKLVDHAVAWGRTVAGVHYEDDNIAGLDMGQEVVAQLLPGHLVDMYGADRQKVQDKVDAMRFSWRDFNQKDPCPETDWMQWSCKSRTRRCSFRGPSQE
mmetsp:Transcript_5267/g.9675  ORF Transcript_5267/g.9675 Transcript_5267/m.9675 type:complete len:227 (+) Transcript_5267:90-770(+)